MKKHKPFECCICTDKHDSAIVLDDGELICIKCYNNYEPLVEEFTYKDFYKVYLDLQS